MSSKKWKCLEIHAINFEELNKVNEAIVVLMKQLKKDTHLELYFFNRYFNERKKEYFIKLGLVNSDKKAIADLDALLKKHEVRKKPYACEMRELNGFPIDFIKCISCECFEKIKEGFEGKQFTIEQLSYLLHFLMNQLGLGYENELNLYKSLAQNIERQLTESQY